MKRLFLLGLISIISSLGFAVEDSELYKATIYSLPEAGKESRAYLGDRVLTTKAGEWRECITPLSTHEDTAYTWTAIYRGGEPICKLNARVKYFTPDYMNSIAAQNHSPDTKLDVRWKKKGDRSSLCLWALFRASNCIKKLRESDVVESYEFIGDPSTYSQVLHYEGKNESILEFGYSEVSQALGIERRVRVLKIDLTVEKTLVYKGAILEIISATNNEMSYKVLRAFSSES
ncbi:hypothetical protein OAM86_02965 [Porticoccaceae bacterium]|jgi:hypothetical protein|nr:hypothetical protein [Porticoccaceae bacterium]